MRPKLALDTNAYRALNEGNTRLAELVRAAASIGLPVTVLGELYHGIYLGKRQAENTGDLNRFLALSRVELLQVDTATARLFGEIAAGLRRIGRPIQQDDMWIAALCKQYGYALATADRDFDAVAGLDIVAF